MSDLPYSLAKLRLYAEKHPISYVENRLIAIGRRPRVGLRRDHFLIHILPSGERLVIIYSIETLSPPSATMVTTAKVVSTIVGDGKIKLDIPTTRAILSQLGFESPNTAAIIIDPFNPRALKAVEVCQRMRVT